MRPFFQVPKLAQVLKDHTDGVLLGTYHALPGQIEVYDTTTATATVSIMLQMLTNAAAGTTIDYPTLVDVPVLQLTGGLAGINLPIATGDPCLVIFADRDIDNWFATGSAQTPNTTRRHSLSDGMAIVGFRPLTKLTQPPDTSSAALYSDRTQVGIKANKINASNATASLLAKLQALVSDINTAISSSMAGITPVTNVKPVATDFTDLLY